MADFVAVLRKTIEGLGETTPDMRRKVYDKARATIAGKLAQITPPPPPAVAERQRRALEDAIALVEGEHKAVPARKTSDPVDDLEAIFASLKEDRTKPGGRTAMPAALAVPKPARTDQPLPSGLVGTVKHQPAPAQQMYDFESRDEEPQYQEEEEFYPAPRRRRSGGWIAALIILLVLAGAAYGAWFKRQEIASALGVDLPRFARVENASLPGGAPAEQPAAPVQQDQAATAPPAAAAKPADDSVAQPPAKAAAAEDVPKYTQRLGTDGTETDPGPAPGEVKIGEGTTVAAATTPPAASVPDNSPPASSTAAPPADGGAQAPAANTALPPANNAAQPPAAAAAGAVAAANGTTAAPPANNAANAPVPVGQRAIFYEERTSDDQGSAQTGSIVWSLVKELPGGDLPPEPAIRAEATIPGKDLQLRMTIRRNTDQTLPASHIIELIFLTPDNFAGGGIDGVLRFAMKDSEEAAGSPLLGIPAKISDGFFLVALNDDKASIDTNLNLLRQQNWIDIPIVYKSGRRALMTLEKGVPGDKVFQQALQAWQGMAGASSGAPASTSGTGTSG